MVTARHATLRRGASLAGICGDSTCKQARSRALLASPTNADDHRSQRSRQIRWIADLRGLIGITS
jgi:hypothetical protein